MDKLVILPIEAGDIADMAAHMRKADRREMIATYGHDDADVALAECYRLSAFSYAVRDDVGRIVAMFGAIPDEYGSAAVWFCSARALRFHRKEFARKCKLLGLRLFDCFDTIYNYVDSRYIKAIRWLSWLGFTATGNKRMAYGGIEFIEMARGM